MLSEISAGVGGTVLGTGIAVAAWIWKNTGKGNGKQVEDTHVFKDICDERHGNLDRQVVEVKSDIKTIGGKVDVIKTAVAKIETIVTKNGGPK